MSAPAMRTQAEKLPAIKPWGRTAAYGIPPVAFSNPKLTFWGWADYTLRAEFQPFFLQVASRPCWCENRGLSSEECQELHPSEGGCICKGKDFGFNNPAGRGRRRSCGPAGAAECFQHPRSGRNRAPGLKAEKTWLRQFKLQLVRWKIIWQCQTTRSMSALPRCARNWVSASLYLYFTINALRSFD